MVMSFYSRSNTNSGYDLTGSDFIQIRAWT